MSELQIPNYMTNRPVSISDLAESAMRMQSEGQQQRLNEMKMANAQQEFNRENQIRQAFASGMPQAQDLYKIDPKFAQQYQADQQTLATNQITGQAKTREFLKGAATDLYSRVSKIQDPAQQQAVIDQYIQPLMPTIKSMGFPMQDKVDINMLKMFVGETPEEAQSAQLQAKIAEKQGLLPFEMAETKAKYGAQFEKAKSLADYEHNLKIQEKQLEQTKPMPASIVKEQNESSEAIANLSSTNADLETLKQNLISGKLNLGMFENMGNRIRGAVGGKFANEESRQYADLITSLEKMRNDSLLLNKGTQTEGDAQRAWDQLFKNITDSKYVAERLQEIQNTNERAAKIKGENINLMRSEYGKEALDFSKQTSQKSALNKSQSNKYLDEWNKLPSGAIFTTPDGKKVRKP